MSRFITFLLPALLLFSGISSAQHQPAAFQPANFHEMRFAHRGGYAYGPENTLETIVRNITERNVTAMEVDVMMTADGYLVLFHDERIGRILEAPEDTLLRDLTLAELKQYPLRDKRLGEIYITELGELVDTLKTVVLKEKRKFLLELDFKPHGDDAGPAVRQLVEGTRKVSKYVGDTLYSYFFVSTFYPEVLKALDGYPEPIVTAFAVNKDPESSVLLARMGFMLAPYFVKKYNCAIIEPNHCRASDRYVKRWKRRRRLINAYTANLPCEKAKLETLKIAYTTNCPDSTCQDDPSDMMGKKKGWCKDCRE